MNSNKKNNMDEKVTALFVRQMTTFHAMILDENTLNKSLIPNHAVITWNPLCWPG